MTPQESADPREAVVAALLAEAADFLTLRPYGHVGPEDIPWFTHGVISHAKPRPDCVVCQWLDRYAALAAAPLPSDTPADGLRETLVAHYVTAIECDHDAKTDTIRCVCSVWTGTPQPSVGKAVEQWADHVLAALDGPRPAGPWTGDPADYDGDEGR